MPQRRPSPKQHSTGPRKPSSGVERRRWLDEGVAADLVFTGDLKAKRAALDDALAGEPVDVIVQPLPPLDGSAFWSRTWIRR